VLTIPTKISNFKERRKVEQLAARRAHNPEVAGSSPVLAIKSFAFKEIFKPDKYYHFLINAGLETFLRPCGSKPVY
jgi:hypothetical protein